MGKGDGKGRDGKGKSGKGKGRGKGADPEAAFKAFMRSQRETLQKWAQRRTQWMEEVGMSNEMESIVCELLEDLRDEATVQLGTDGAAEHDATVKLLTRACSELKFHVHHVQQAVAILLAKEGGGVTLRERPDLLSSCLDWLCVNVPVDELPLRFRPKLRPTVVRRASGGLLGGGGGGGGERSAMVTGAVRHRVDAAVAGAAPPAPAVLEWTCGSCTLLNPVDAERCDACGAPMSDEERARLAQAGGETRFPFLNLTVTPEPYTAGSPVTGTPLRAVTAIVPGASALHRHAFIARTPERLVRESMATLPPKPRLLAFEVRTSAFAATASVCSQASMVAPVVRYIAEQFCGCAGFGHFPHGPESPCRAMPRYSSFASGAAAARNSGSGIQKCV